MRTDPAASATRNQISGEERQALLQKRHHEADQKRTVALIESARTNAAADDRDTRDSRVGRNLNARG